ncbi:protein kinase, putative [Leishmania tarentolae]|uniref:non-specific serine/threonine protein kinase n=1 Tax=Leishmania tarentolae TaxID=5689 RepID=A0A640KS52_LEITA|nr:protein kinase, putative [Leishmania tarentolae]
MRPNGCVSRSFFHVLLKSAEPLSVRKMGNHFSVCPEPIHALISSWSIAPISSSHPSGVTVNGVEYSAVKLVGEGAYSFVYDGYNNATGQRVALKRYVFSEPQQQQDAIEAMNIYRDVCPNEYIVTYLDSEIVYRHGVPLPEMWVVMEFCDGPSLQEYINNRLRSPRPFSVREVFEIVDTIVHAIGHLHAQSPPVSHWDIKPDNFLFTDTGRLKLCDFGSATRQFYAPRSAEEVAAAESELGSRMTLLYRPPESLDLWSKDRVDSNADIWSLGVIIYVLVFREMPFEANPMEVMAAVPKRYKCKMKDDCPEEFRGLMEIVRTRMLTKKPAERADIFTISEELEKITHLMPLSRPRPGFQSVQRPRFA